MRPLRQTSKDLHPTFPFIFCYYYVIVSIFTTVQCEQLKDHVDPTMSSPEEAEEAEQQNFFIPEQLRSFLPQQSGRELQPPQPSPLSSHEDGGRTLHREKRKVDAAGNSFEIAFIIDGPNKVSLKQKAQQLVYFNSTQYLTCKT